MAHYFPRPGQPQQQSHVPPHDPKAQPDAEGVSKPRRRALPVDLRRTATHIQPAATRLQKGEVLQEVGPEEAHKRLLREEGLGKESCLP